MAVDVAAYYFPGYHADPRTGLWHGRGWTEWELVRRASPRYEGQYQPRVPSWGYFDEASPLWAQRQIDLAADHGLSVFLFDWYWYDGQEFLNGALDRGFLAAANNNRMSFALMWANHDWLDIHPAKAFGTPRTLLRGDLSPAEFDKVADHIVDEYFSRPNYYRIDGEPFFSIYDLPTFIKGMGSLTAAQKALSRLRDKACEAGLPGVHVNVILRDSGVLPGEHTLQDSQQTIEKLGVSSVGSYVWIHHYPPGSDGFPAGSYQRAFQANVATWGRFRQAFGMPYFPNVTVGWDSSPRACQSDFYEDRGYPWLAVLDGNTPEAFEQALRRACQFAEQEQGRGLVTINAWNEWTEGSYLLPDERYGTSYLDAVRRVAKNV